ncbi:hypothetical protein JT358_01780 [Micrococcales bacterium 31B]|nr:hypothetical protein [Micrococcales bacterium 31B]
MHADGSPTSASPVRRAEPPRRYAAPPHPDVSRVASMLQRYVDTHPDSALGVALSASRERVELYSTLATASVLAHLGLPARDLERVQVFPSAVSLAQAQSALDAVSDLPWGELGIVSAAVGILSQAIDVTALDAEWPAGAPLTAHTAPTPALAALVERLAQIADARGVGFTLAPGEELQTYS